MRGVRPEENGMKKLSLRSIAAAAAALGLATAAVALENQASGQSPSQSPATSRGLVSRLSPRVAAAPKAAVEP